MSGETPYLGPRLLSTRGHIAEQLWLYGEDELALTILHAPTETYRAVLARALNPDCPGPAAAEIARGAVQALTGEARPTARLRARPRAGLGAFWQRAGTDPASQPTAVEQFRELRGDRPLPPPHPGPWVDSGHGPSAYSNGRDGVLWHLRQSTPRRPWSIFTRANRSGVPYIQTYRLGHGRTLVEHRDAGEETHRHLVAATTAEAATLVQAWVDDGPAWRAATWLPGMPDRSLFGS